VTARLRGALLTGIALAAAALFILYLRQSRSVAVGSDGGSIALQAWDMLHGNFLLHGWAMSDVSFYSTELPQYALLEWVHGLSPDVVHVGGAMTYTIVLLLAALVAMGKPARRGPRDRWGLRGLRGLRGGAHGERAVRAAITAGIMLAPAPGDGSSTLLLTPDHLGSTVPVLLVWLVVDRCRPRWYVPVAVGILLAWGLVADPLLEVTGVAPLVLVCAVRAAQRLHPKNPKNPKDSQDSQDSQDPKDPQVPKNPRDPEEPEGPQDLGHPRRPASAGAGREHLRPAGPARWSTVAVRTERVPVAAVSRAVGASGWFELSLAAAALAAVGAAALVSALITAAGGFALRPVGTSFAGFAALPHNIRLTVQGIGVLFGAFFGRGQPVNVIFSSLHLVGVALFAAAFFLAWRRFFRPQEFLVPALALAITLNLILYVHGNYVQNLLSSREITEVLPLGAVLAGRVLAGPVLKIRVRGRNVLGPALAVVLAGYAVALAVYAAQPPVSAEHQDLAGWLVTRHLTHGLAIGYWLANSVTIDSGDHAEVREVSIRNGMLAAPDSGWGFARQWYTAAGHDADFVVTDAAPGTATWHSSLTSARNTFGPPARIYSYRQYTVLVWSQNLLTRLG
jgi:hypothetical protein